MNKKYVLIRNFFIAFAIFMVFFLTTSFFFGTSGESDVSECKMLAENIIVRLDDGNEDISTMCSALHDNDIVHVTFYDIGISTPTHDTHVTELTEDPNFNDVRNAVVLKQDDALKSNAFVIYRECKKRTLVIRVAKATSLGYKVAKTLMIYGNIVVFVLTSILYVFFYIQFKRSLLPLKQQVLKLQAITQTNPPSKYKDDIGYLAYILRDSRHKLVKQLEETRISNQKLDFILDSFSQGLVVLDGNYKVVMINEAALGIFMMEKSDIQGRHFDTLPVSQNIVSNFSMVIQTNKGIDFIEKIGSRYYQCVINPIHYQWAKSVVKEDKSGASLLMVDITDDYNSSEMKKEFFANASHELKSPLTTTIGYLQLIENGTIKDEKEINSAIDKCVANSNRMNKIISDMLTLSSLEKESLRPIEEVDIASSVDAVVESLKFVSDERGIAICEEGDSFTTKINPDDLERLIRNIVENAIKYNKENGSITIIVSSVDRTVSVKDTGIGIASENQARIFERFFRVDKARSRKNGGTGLGLAIVKHICNYYDLDIQLVSELGIGSTFTIKFPD